MTRKKTRRKHWNLVNPILHAIQGAAITDAASLNELRKREYLAVEAFRTGKATKDDWRSLADMLNLCETMALGGIGPEALEACGRAQEALGNAQQRYKAGKSLGFTGPELTAMREVYEYHDLQRQSVSRSEYERAIQTTANRIRSAHPSVKVCV
jgi:hypothetical protein